MVSQNWKHRYTVSRRACRTDVHEEAGDAQSCLRPAASGQLIMLCVVAGYSEAR
jgi:hypothetical protein